MPPLLSALRYHSARWLLTTFWFHRALGLAVPIFSLLYAWHADKAERFSRAGSIMCLTGGFLTFRRYLRGAEDDFRRDTGIADQPAFRYLDPLTAKMQARATDFMAVGWGIWFIVFGTVIWGYGDWILLSLHICKQ